MTNPGGVDASKFNTKYRAVKQPKYINKAIGEGRDKTNDDKKADPYTVINSFSKKRLKKIAKLKLMYQSHLIELIDREDLKNQQTHKKGMNY
jgi:hypothetical protein